MLSMMEKCEGEKGWKYCSREMESIFFILHKLGNFCANYMSHPLLLMGFLTQPYP